MDNNNKKNVKTICQLFEENTRKNPDNIAMEYKGICYSYKTLNEKANILAHFIRKHYQQVQKKNLLPDTPIAISLERSADFVIGILAILKAGGAYVSINPDYPDKRIQAILDDIQSPIIITNRNNFQKFEAMEAGLSPIFMEDTIDGIDTNPNIPIHASHLAYIIYTSGSTGKPKGILAEHINVVAQVVSASYLHANAEDTIAFFSDVAFDSSTVEIWGALLNGAKLYIPDNFYDLLSDPVLFKETVLNKKINIILFTRSLFDLLYKLDNTVFASLKLLMVGAEALTKSIMLELMQSPYSPKEVINAYGPSENNTFCITNRLTRDFGHLSSVPIGKPYSNRIAFVLDKHKQLMPVGVVGELYVGGYTLSRGYLNQRELTEKSFIPNPFINACDGRFPRIYKTNDQVRWLPEGNLEYIGRNDFQVKLRGYRIELAEIEMRMLECVEIKHAVVLLDKHEGIGYLVAYYVSDKPLDEDSMRSNLSLNLPEYMIPSIFMHLQTIPTNSNGKLDRKALPVPSFEKTTTDMEAFYSDPIMKKIAHIWSRVLNVSQFGSDQSFFDLGGNSLVAMSIRKEIEDTFDISFNIVELFEHTTLSKLSNRIRHLIDNQKDETIKITEPVLKNAIDEPIAIVGIACKLPSVNNKEEFWDLLVNEKSNLVDFSLEELKNREVSEARLHDKNYVKRGAVFEDTFSFDAGFFGYSVKDAELMDPQQRIFLQCAWEAMEDSGNVPEKFAGDIGVFASQGRNYYFMDYIGSNPELLSDTQLFQTILGNEKDFLSTRVSYKFNLTGPSLTLQTACSSSLVSIQMACESLKTRSSDMALAGGVSIFYNYGYPWQEDLIESPDGYCRAFDANAKGTVVTSGVGVVVLKRLCDAIRDKDSIYAIIKGGALNNDGGDKMAFTAPSVKGQMAVIEKALKNADVGADSISYIEAHGTGTILGDPIEWTALHKVYQKYVDTSGSCTIGAVKTNIGHTDAAAGVFGLIKTALALKNQTLPATLNFKNLNPEIATFNTIFKVASHTASWESKDIRRAAISSFGLGGTNSHLILEEYLEENIQETNDFDYTFIPFSAKNQESLFGMTKKWKEYLAKTNCSNFRNIAYTAQEGRTEFKERGYFLLNEADASFMKFKIGEDEYIQNPELVFILSELSEKAIEGFEELSNQFPVFKKAYATCRVLSGNIMNNRIASFCLYYAFFQLLDHAEIKLANFIAEGIFTLLVQVLENKLTLEAGLSMALQEDGLSDIGCNVKIQPKADRIYVQLGSHPEKNPSAMKFDIDTQLFWEFIGVLWIKGVHVNWSSLQLRSENRRKISIPGYVFSRKHFQVKKHNRKIEPIEKQESIVSDSMEDSFKSIWSKVLGVSSEDLNTNSDFLELGGDSLTFIDLLKHIDKKFGVYLKLEDLVKNPQLGMMMNCVESNMV